MTVFKHKTKIMKKIPNLNMSKIEKIMFGISQKIHIFGDAMVTPVLLITFAGVLAGIASIFTNTIIVGNLANESTFWFRIWNIITEVALIILRPSHIPVLFVIGLPINLAKKHKSEACMECFILYLSFIYFLKLILTYWKNTSIELTFKESVFGIHTLDMGIIGSILVVGITIFLHNHYFDLDMPEFFGIYQGMVFVYLVGFFSMFFLAFACAFLWPSVQCGIASMQYFFIYSGNFGIFMYGFLERILVPTGLHHFIYIPFIQDNAIVKGGIITNWVTNVDNFSKSIDSLKTLFPAGRFSLFGNAKVFGSIGISLAFYATAKSERKKQVLSFLFPATLTAVLFGITEPLEFIFLFSAPLLFFIYSVLAGVIGMVMYMFGVSGCMYLGLIEMVSTNWIPLSMSHGFTYITQIAIGLIFIAIYFTVFKVIIEKFNYKTIGRENESEQGTINKAIEDAMTSKKLCFSQKIYNDEMEQFKKFLKKLGMNENNRRFKEIAFAAVLLKHYQNIDEVEITPGVFSYMGKILNIQPKSIHANFRNALDRHWLNTDFRILEEHYKGPISEFSGAPTPKDFLIYIVKEAINGESKVS